MGIYRFIITTSKSLRICDIKDGNGTCPYTLDE